MYPEEHQYSVDYLNQITPAGPPKRSFSRKQLFIMGGAGLALIIGIVIIIAGSLGNNGPSASRLAAKLIGIEKIVGDSQSKLKSSTLRSLNSTLKIYLTNTNRDIAEPLSKADIDTSKLSKDLLAAESGSALSTRLDDAKLNAVFDRTYAREMAYELDTIMSSMQAIYKTTKSVSLKEYLTKAYTDLQPIQKQFAEFNE